MNLQDALFNWLQMHIVQQARPEDLAAKDTLDFFRQILEEDKEIDQIHLEADDSTYIVHYRSQNKEEERRFSRESAEQLLQDINSNSKYNQ